MADDSPFYCAEHSRAVGEQLFGTAPLVKTALILESNGRWERKVLDGDGLPEPVRARLAAYKESLPAARVCFIRRGRETNHAPGITFFVALIREDDPALYAFELASYDDLLTLDIDGIVAEAPAFAGHRRTEPLILVCTHGRRDRSCARYGPPVYEQLAAQVGDSVWQTSHVGGHRMAANVVALPHGVYYGRVDRAHEHTAAFVEAIQSGHLYLDAYRGRACYVKVVQAADYYLRRATGILALDAFRLAHVQQTADEHWLVTFTARADGTAHDIQLRPAESEFLAYMNSEGSDPETVIQYHLAGHRTRPATTP